jgi:protein-disulfide isomerase
VFRVNPAAVTESDHCIGPNDAPLTLIEYGDYECPFCIKAFPIIEKIRAQFGDKVRLVYRHVPKSRAQAFAKQAAEAAEFAASQGLFWEMHQALFSNPDWREVEQLIAAAKSIGLDPEACRKALAERTFAERVREITVESVRAGIIGTPTLFINGARYEDRIEEEPLTRAIEAALSKR